MGLSEDGYTLSRVARALAVSRGSVPQARSYLEAQHGVMSLAARIVQKGVIDTGSITGEVDAAAASTAFLALSRPLTIIDAINAISPFPEVPIAQPFMVEGTGALAFWTKEGEAIKTTRESFATMQLEPRKIASLLVLTVEMLRLIGPAGDAMLNRALKRAASKAEGEAFLSDDADDGTTPGGILHNATSTAATGDLNDDIKALTDSFEGNLSSSVFLLPPSLAISLAIGGASFGVSDIGVAQVGTLAGIPALAHSAVPADDLVLLDPSMIAMAPRLFVTDASTQASIEVTDDDDTTTTLVSLWQENLSSLRLLEFCNWFPAPGSVSVLTGASAPPATRKGGTA